MAIIDREQIVNDIIMIEWKMFHSVTDISGHMIECQNDPKTFQIMRKAQHLIWTSETLLSYLNDMKTAESKGINLVAEKYARMMAYTHPAEYAQIKNQLLPVPNDALQLIDQIMQIFMVWDKEIAARYPLVRSLGRPEQNSTEKNGMVTINTYLRGELLTYSVNTLRSCLSEAINAQKEGINLAIMTLTYTAYAYGFSSLEQMEQKLKSF